MRYFCIAGHGSGDPGATGYIRKGEHRFMKEDLFPAMKKYAGKEFVFHDSYNVYLRGDIVRLARKHKADAVIEFHFDASGSKQASGGHVIVYSHYKPDKMDLRLRDTIKSMVGVRYSHEGHRGISGRSNLANVNRTASGRVNYRLVELGFGTNKKDADILMKQTDEYAKKLVGAIKGGKVTPSTSTPVDPSKPVKKTIQDMVEEIEGGLHGNGHENRRKSLRIDKATYAKVRSLVNKRAGIETSKPKPKRKSNKQIAKEVIEGKWGNNPQRAKKLAKAGYNASKVQAEVNKLVGGNKKSAATIADEIYRGKGNWGTAATRERRLRKAGYNPSEVQRLVNKKFK